MFSGCLRQLGLITFGHDGRTIPIDEFCQAMGQFDPALAVKIKAWHVASQALLQHIDERSEGAQPPGMIKFRL